ncbi:Signal peptidase I [Aquisphaera giovannonii]|uniref:Signal peptidase I n=1 Tax=Aquisphaera giovannonii TaxID=406548 RepID=A0A5B9WAV5_9BACT|nr:signal peptidase I [Aquisphaera giovannonii]QEH37653.1 Signal peptidase I [Aquisphaera giovannonii]
MGRTASALQPGTAPKSKGKTEEERPGDGFREIAEAVVVAFVAALVARGFEAQAFVIPTGSMAPTLLGRHKELTCPQCGFVYTINASDEVESRGHPRRVDSGVCVNCRYQTRGLTSSPSFKGDRILVSMFPYDLPFLPGASPPERWDVVVFRYPEEPEVSYIKRLVGLPGETIRIRHGDVYVRPPGGQGFSLARKPLEHQSSMQITVYDDRYRPKALEGLDAWRRWRPAAADAWKEDASAPATFRSAAATAEWAELRYRHLAPDPEQWESLEQNEAPLRGPRSSLITDFYSYNTNLSSGDSDLVQPHGEDAERAWLQPHWVGDLTLQADVQADAAAGEVRLELIKGGVTHRATIDVATGRARLDRGDAALKEFATALRGPGSHHVELANVDDRLTLLVDGRAPAEEGEGAEYDRGDDNPVPTAMDLSPAAVAIRGGTFRVSNLVLKRDIYYTQYPGRHDYGSTVFEDRTPRNAAELLDVLADPARFPGFGKGRSHDYQLGDDRYMMLGDNSPRSKDSRGWDSSDTWDTSNRQSWEVPRNLVTGKAFFVYWPHGVPFGPTVGVMGGDTRLPFRPYFERMRWIR